MKFKHCCEGQTDWGTILEGDTSTAAQAMRITGRNNYFLCNIMAALQVDSLQGLDIATLKRAVTPATVVHLHRTIEEIWPDLADFESVVSRDRDGVSALYTGSFDPPEVIRAVRTLSLYCDTIYLIDPFKRASKIREEFNPLVHPEKYRATTFRNISLWIALGQWVMAGIVKFIRPIEEFIPGMTNEILGLQRQKFDRNPELKALLEEQVQEQIAAIDPFDGGMGEYYLLSHSDEAIREIMKEFPGPAEEIDRFIKTIDKRRDAHPFFMKCDGERKEEFLITTSGGSYETARRTCKLTGSHLVTDLKSRWREIELDRSSAQIDEGGWSPFAQVLQRAPLKVLNEVPLSAALRLREEQRLASMRNFLRRVWRKASNPETQPEAVATDFAAELSSEIAAADKEWKAIDTSLAKWLGHSVAALVASQGVGFVPAATTVAITGAAKLVQTRWKKNDFQNHFPAGFFLR